MKWNLILWLGGLLLALGRPAPAQEDYPRVELFGGFSYVGVGFMDARGSGLGTGVGLTGNFHRRLGVTLEYTRQEGSHGLPPGHPRIPRFFGDVDSRSSAMSQWLIGPRLAVRGAAATGFAHALIGRARLRAETVSGSSEFSIIPPILTPPPPTPPRLIVIPGFDAAGLAMGFGGGVDVHLGRYASLRLLQVDYLPTRLRSQWEHNVRVQVGAVLRFGFR